MTKHSATIDADENVFLTTIGKRTGVDMYEATIAVYGTFGGGTVTLQGSPDGGTTKINLRDISGSVVSITSDDVFNVRLGYANKLGDELMLYANMSGSTTPAVTVDVFDNRA